MALAQSKQLSSQLVRTTGIRDNDCLVEEPGAVNVARLVLERGVRGAIISSTLTYNIPLWHLPHLGRIIIRARGDPFPIR